MFKQFRTAVLMLGCLTLLTGGLYPLVVTGFAQVLFPRQANGSLIIEGDRKIGSELIGQQFTGPQYFWGRLSATGPVPYNAAASSGSNFGPQHPGLREAVSKRIADLTADGTPAQNIPVDLVTSSGSGLDPQISPAAAAFQVPRVARERRLTDDQVRKLVAEQTEGRELGLLGEPRVNVLRLNLALDRLQNQGK